MQRICPVFLFLLMACSAKQARETHTATHHAQLYHNERELVSGLFVSRCKSGDRDFMNFWYPGKVLPELFAWTEPVDNNQRDLYWARRLYQAQYAVCQEHVHARQTRAQIAEALYASCMDTCVHEWTERGVTSEVVQPICTQRCGLHSAAWPPPDCVSQFRTGEMPCKRCDAVIEMQRAWEHCGVGALHLYLQSSKTPCSVSSNAPYIVEQTCGPPPLIERTSY